MTQVPANPISVETLTVPADMRHWPYYPIEMPLTQNGEGPATVGKDAAKIVYEVWDAATFGSEGSFSNLPDAINKALRLTAAELAENIAKPGNNTNIDEPCPASDRDDLIGHIKNLLMVCRAHGINDPYVRDARSAIGENELHRVDQEAYDKGWSDGMAGQVFNPPHKYVESQEHAYENGFTDARTQKHKAE